MSWALDEFFASVEDEFRIDAEPTRHALTTPGEVVDYVMEQSTVGGDLGDEQRREHISAIVHELMAQVLGITRYAEHSRFVEDLKV